MNNPQTLDISDFDRQKILEVLEGLPPIEYCYLCDTLPQLWYWIALSNDYMLLKTSFSNYFAGIADLNSKDLKDEYLFYLMRDWYLAFYSMVQVNWQEIEVKAKSKNIDLSSIPVRSPGEALIRAIENDCGVFFKVCTLPLHRWSPSESRKLAKMDREISQAIAVGATPKDLKKYQNLLKQKISSFSQELGLKNFCIAVCASAKKGTTAKRKYNEFRRIQAQLDTHIQSLIHPRKKVRGHEWKDGECKLLGNVGGV